MVGSTLNTHCFCIILFFQVFLFQPAFISSSWDQWWTYDGISGVEFWGLLNPKWSHCNKGRRQSPVDVNPDLLLYDPGLTAINVNGDQITGQLLNTGRGLEFKLANPLPGEAKGNSTVTMGGGPLSYDYALSHLLFHYGRGEDRGSEHTISTTGFPAELQLYFFNTQLYNSWEEAVDQPNGLAAIAVLVQITRSGTSANSQLKHLFHSIETVKYKGAATKVHKLSFSQLLPNLRQYITYEGSLTQPSCVETVQWIISNKPIYMTHSDLQLIRNTIVLEGHGEGNFRPTQAMNSRSLRTNISKEPPVDPAKGHSYSKVTNGGLDEDQEKVNKLNNKKFCSGRGYLAYKGKWSMGEKKKEVEKEYVIPCIAMYGRWSDQNRTNNMRWN